MTEALVVSNVLLWILLVALAATVLALTRQIGVLHERLAPVGALAMQRGPAVGERAPELALVDLAGRVVRVGGETADGRRTLLFFLSPTCPVCKTLLPTLRRVVAEQSPPVRLVLASDGDPEEQRRFAGAQGLSDLPYVLSSELGMRFQIAKLPSAVLLDESGVIRAKGLVNTREHLESLFEADARDVASLQEYVSRQAQAGRTRSGAAS